MARAICRFEGCEKTSRGEGLCPGHYKQYRLSQELRPLVQYGKNIGQTCRGPQCDRPAESVGLCGSHKSQRARGQELAPIGLRRSGPARMYDGVVCRFEGCSRQAAVHALCHSHNAQLKRGAELKPLAAARVTPEIGHRSHNSEGYVWVWNPQHPNALSTGRVMEHVMVMAEALGRPLIKGETVHHKNGVKDDNEPANLELWVTHQPRGQRPADLVAWAEEILRRYGSMDAALT